MTTKIQIKSIFGSVLFGYEKENNSIKDTVEKAVREKEDLYGASLPEASLPEASLSEANLYGASLPEASLPEASLSEANLYGAKNISDASIPIYSKWQVSILGDKIKIGCKKMTIEQWDKWFSGTKEFETKRGTEDFHRIEANYLAAKAYMQHMEKYKNQNKKS